MGKKRFIACLLAILLIAVSAVTLAACKPKNAPIILPDVPAASVDKAPGTGELLLTMLRAMGKEGEFTSMKFESDIKTNLNPDKEGAPIWDKRKFYLKGNFMNDQKDDEGNVIEPGAVELGLGITCPDDPSQDIELFLRDGRFYLKAAGTTMYLEDIDFRWIIEQLKKIESLQTLVDKIFAMIPGLELDSKVDELINIVAMLIFQTDTNLTTYTENSKSGHIALKFNPDQLIGTVIGALGGTSIDGLLQSVGLILRGADGKPIYIDQFLKTLAFPNIDVYVEADIKDNQIVMDKNENSDYFGLQLHVYDYQGEYFHMSTDSKFSNEKIDFIPENINTYVPFGLMKLKFDTEFSMHINDLDVGKLVEFFAGNSNLLPTNSLIVSLNADLDIKLKVDLRLKKDLNGETQKLEDKSMLALEIFKKGESVPMVGIYLKDEKIYVNLDNLIATNSDQFNMNVLPGNIVVSGVHISQWFTDLLDYGKGIVSDLLDGFLADPEEDDDAAATFGVVSSELEFVEGFDKKDIIRTVSHDSEGKAIINNTIGTILNVIRYTTTFEDFLEWTSDGNIKLKIDHEFFKHLCTQFGVKVPELENMKDFGKITLDVNFSEKGLDSIIFDVDFNETVANIQAKVKLDNFGYGFNNSAELREYIDGRTENKEYAGNLKDFIFSAIDDIDLEFTARLDIGAGEYHANNILGIDTGLPNIAIKVESNFVLELNLKIRLQVETLGNEKYIARAYIGITNVHANPIFPKAGTIHINYLDKRYDKNNIIENVNTKDGVNGVLFVDMSEFSLIQLSIPSFAIGVDLTDLVFGMLNGIDFDLAIPDIVISDILDSLINPKQGAAQTFAATDDNNEELTKEQILTKALFAPQTSANTSTLLKLMISQEMVTKILQLVNNSVETPIEFPPLPEFKLIAEIDTIEGIKLNISTQDGEKPINLNLAVNRFDLGKNIEININDFSTDFKKNPYKYGDPIDFNDILGLIQNNNMSVLSVILGDIVYRAFDDTDIKFDLSIFLQEGEYNLANLFGIETGLPAIPVKIGNGGQTISLELSIKIQSALVPETDITGAKTGNMVRAITRAFIELKFDQNALISSGNSNAEKAVINIMYFDDRYESNEGLSLTPYKAVQVGNRTNGTSSYKVEKTHGTLLVDLSAFELMKLSLPNLAFDVDLNEVLKDFIGKLNFSDITVTNDNNDIKNKISERLLSAIADSEEEVKGANYLEVAFANELINELLALLKINLDFELPEVEGAIKLDTITGLELNARIPGATADADDVFSVHLGLPKLQLGTYLSNEDMAVPSFNISDFGSAANLDLNSLLQTVIFRALDDVDMNFKLSIELTKGTYNIANLFGIETGLPAIPIEISENQTIALDLSIKIQSKLIGTEQVVTRALIELGISANALTSGGTLRLLYVDDRDKANVNEFGLTVKGKDGKETNGTLFVNLSSIELLKLALPDIAFDVDLTEFIKKFASEIKLSDLTLTDGENASERLLAAVADTKDSGANYLQVAFANELINELLALLGVNLEFELPDISGDITLDNVDGLRLNVVVTDPTSPESSKRVLTGYLGLKKLHLGTNLDDSDIAKPANFKAENFGKPVKLDLNALDASALIQSLIYRALDDVDAELNFNLHLDPGTYNVAKLFGIDTGLPAIPIEITGDGQDINIKLTIKIQTRLVDIKDSAGNVIGQENVITRAIIELAISENALITSPNGGAIRIIYLDDRYDTNNNFGLAQYEEGKKTHGTAFVNLSSIEIMNLSLPDLAFDIDLNEVIKDFVGNISLSDLTGMSENADAVENSVSRRLLSAIADTKEGEANETVGYLSVKITTELVNQLLVLFGLNLEIELPPIGGAITIDTAKGLDIKVNVIDRTIENGNNVEKTLSVHLGLPKLHLGANLQDQDVALPNGFHAENFGDAVKLDLNALDLSALIQSVIYRALDDVDVEFNLNLHLDPGVYNVNKLFGIDTGLPAIPVEITGDGQDINIKLTIKIQTGLVNIKDSAGKVIGQEKVITRAIIELAFSENALITSPNGGAIRIIYLDDRYDTNNNFGLAQYQEGKKTHGTAFVNLSSIEIMKFSLPDLAFDIDLNEVIKDFVGNISLSDLTGMSENADAVENSVSRRLLSAIADTKEGEANETVSYLSVKLTTELVNQLLDLFKVNLELELPPIGGAITIKPSEGLEIKVNVIDRTIENGDNVEKTLSVHLGLPKLHLGANLQDQDVALPNGFHAENFGEAIKLDLDSIDLTALIQSVIFRALDDVDIKFELNIHLDGGEYDLSKLFGIDTTLPQIPIIISEKGADISIELSIKLQSALVPVLDIEGKPVTDSEGKPTGEMEKVITRAIIELKFGANALITSPNGGAIRIMYFDDRYEGNKALGLTPYKAVKVGSRTNGTTGYTIEKTHGTLLVNLSSLELMKLSLPDLAFDIDFNDLIKDIVSNIKLPGIAAASEFTNANAKNSASERLLSAINDTTEPEEVSYLKVAFANELVNQLLALLKVNVNITLPPIDGAITIKPSTGLDINVNVTEPKEDGKVSRTLKAHLGLPKINFGTNLEDADIDVPEGFDIKNFGSPTELDINSINLNTLLKKVIYSALDDVALEFALKFEIKAGTYYIDRLFTILESLGVNIDIGNHQLPIVVGNDFVLDLTLKIEMRWNDFDDDKVGKDEKKLTSGITRAKISLYNWHENIFFNKASANENDPVLTAYYFDDRGVSNGQLNDQDYRYGVHGKKTHGTLYLDLTEFEFAKLRLPSLAIDVDLTDAIESVISGINLSDISLGGGASAASAMSQRLAAVADGDGEEQDNHYIQVQITMTLIMNLLRDIAGMEIELPDLLDSVEGDFTISQIDGISLNIKLPVDHPDEPEKELGLGFSLGIKKIQLGKEVDIPIKQFAGDYFDQFGGRCIDSVSTIIARLLDDTSVELSLTADVPAGKYDLAPILSLAGLDMDSLYVNFNEAFRLDLTLRIQLQMDEIEENNEKKKILSRAKIELISNCPNFIFPGNPENPNEPSTVISAYYFDERYTGNSELNLPKKGTTSEGGILKKTYGTLFANFSGLSIANINIPPVKLDIDLTESLIDQLDKALSNSAMAGNSGVVAQSEMSGRTALGMIADAMADGADDDAGLGNYLHISIVTGLVNELLNSLGVDIGFKLPEGIQVDVGAFSKTGISITIGAQESSEDGRLQATLSFPELSLGRQNVIDATGFSVIEYSTDVANVVKGLAQYGDISAKITVSANQSQLDIQRLLNNLANTTGLTIQWPITVDLNDFSNDLYLNLKWALDYETPYKSKLLLELYCDGLDEANKVMGLYINQGRSVGGKIYGNVYADLTGVGLFKFALTQSNLVEKIVTILNTELDKLSSLINDKLSGGTKEIQAQAASAYGMSVGEMNSQLYERAISGALADDMANSGISFNPNDPMSYISVLLSGLVVEDGVIQLSIAEEVVRALLGSLSVNIAEEISLEAKLDIFSGKLGLTAHIEEITLDAELSINNIGKFHEIDINISSGDYPELNASRTDLFMNTLFDSLEPGLWIDLISKNEAIGNNFRYTKIQMQKVPAEGMSLPATNGGWANGGSILLKLFRMDVESDYSGRETLYIALDIKNNRINIRGTRPMIPIEISVPGIANLQGDTMLNIYIPFDIKGMLSGLLDGVIKEINKVDKPATNTPSNDIAPVRAAFDTFGPKLNAIFDGFDILSLLQQINVKIYGLRNIKVSVDLDPSVINDKLPKLLNAMNGEYVSLGGANSFTIGGLNYNAPGNNSGFPTNLWNTVVLPIIKVAAVDGTPILGGVWGIAEGIIKRVQPNIENLISRVLPFPKLNSLTAQVNVVQGKLDNVQVLGYGDGSGSSRQRFELMLFNNTDAAGTGSQVFFGTLPTADLVNSQIQASYIHFDAAVDSADNFMNKFTTTAYKATADGMYYESENPGQPYVLKAKTVDWTIEYFSTEYFGKDNMLAETLTFDPATNDFAAFKTAEGNWKSGYYVARATVKNLDSITVRVVVEDNAQFLIEAFDNKSLTIDPITVRAGRSLPDSIAVKGKDSAGNEKEVYIRNVAGAMDKFKFVGAGATQVGAHDVNGTVTINFTHSIRVPSSGETLTSIAGIPVKVHYDNATMTLVDSDKPIEISIMDYKDFYKNYYHMSDDPLLNKVFVQTADNRKIYQQFKDVRLVGVGSTTLFEVGTNGKILVDEQGNPRINASNLDLWLNGEGISEGLYIEYEFDVKVKDKEIGNTSDTEQYILQRQVVVKPRVPAFVRLDAKNTVVLDTIQDEKDLPTTARVYFKTNTAGVYDEKTYHIRKWNLSGVEFKKEGVYDNVSFTLEQDSEDSVFVDNNGELKGQATNVITGITIAINEAEIEYAKYGNDEGKFIKISYEDFADNKFNEIDLRLVTSAGKVVDYEDRFTFTRAYKRAAIPAGQEGNYPSNADKSEKMYWLDGDNYATVLAQYKADYIAMLNATTPESLDGLEGDAYNAAYNRNMQKENERARWTVVTETVNNYEVLKRGITVGKDGDEVRVTVNLKWMTARPYEFDGETIYLKPYDSAENYQEVYMYLKVEGVDGEFFY